MDWHTTPPTSGRYFAAECIAMWDLNFPVEVRRIEDRDGVRLEATVRHYRANCHDLDVKDSFFDQWIWYGPLPAVPRPSSEFVAKWESDNNLGVK